MFSKKPEAVESESSPDVASGEVETSHKICYTRYNSPFWQIVIVSFVAFGCPGMYNALSGIGGGGQLDTTTQAKGHIALSSVSAAGNLLIAPVVTNILGPKWTILMGGLPYILYAGSLLAYTHTGNQGFVIGASALLGIGASLLWIAQGAIMTGYPLPQQQGRMIGIFWIIFNLGGFLGDMISFGLNFHSKSGTVSDSTYIAFMCIMAAGCACSLALLKPYNVIREDNSRAATKRAPRVMDEFLGVLKVFKDWRVISLIPFWMAANYAYNYQQNTFNAKLFTIRTRSFNGAMYWLAQMVSSYMFGLFLDNKSMTRRMRGIWGFVITAIISMAVWSGGLAAQLKRAPNSDYYGLNELDLVTSGSKFAGPFLLYFFYGGFDAVWQTLVYWTIGYLSHESPEQAARYVGAFKCAEAVGSAIASKVNSDKTNYNIEFAVDWSFVVFALIWAIPFAWSIQDVPAHSGQDTEYIERSKSSDEEA
ncbi:hypothetical protein N7490_007487 [Penicillium lividum]|nr:hypothetical protein N7490_007487 [Penicillium lividum]